MWRRIAAGLALALLLTPAASAEEPNPVTRQLQSMQVQAVQQEILSNPQLFEQVLALQASPAFQSILQDAELLAKAQSGDLLSLLGDRRLAALADDPVVKALAHDLER